MFLGSGRGLGDVLWMDPFVAFLIGAVDACLVGLFVDGVVPFLFEDEVFLEDWGDEAEADVLFAAFWG